MNKSVQIFLVFFIAVVGIAALLNLNSKPSMKELKKSVAPTASIYLEAKSVAGKLNFINDASKETHLSEITDGKWALLYFGYASCPDICPIDLSKINLTYQMMENNRKLQVIFVSVDPMRDIGNLDNFTSAFNSSFLGLTAHQDELVQISRALGVYHEVAQSQKISQEDHSDHSHEHYEIDHTSTYLLFNPELKLTALLSSPHEPESMANAIDKIIEALR